jgi:hypothetical protein
MFHLDYLKGVCVPLIVWVTTIHTVNHSSINLNPLVAGETLPLPNTFEYSLISKHLQRINLRRPPCRNPAGQQETSVRAP